MQQQTGSRGGGPVEIPVKNGSSAKDVWKWIAISLLTMFLGMGVEYFRAGRDFDSMEEKLGAVQASIAKVQSDVQDMRERLARVEERQVAATGRGGG